VCSSDLSGAQSVIDAVCEQRRHPEQARQPAQRRSEPV